MSKQPKILFLTAPIGSGHIRAAHAVVHAVERIRPDVKIKAANVFDFFNPLVGQTILRFYLRILELCPSVYGMAYRWGNGNRAALAGRNLISRYLAGKMRDYIACYEPSAVVCTHATPAGLAAFLKQNRLLTVPVFAVITDFTVHRLLVYPELDCYFVADTGMKERLIHYGVPCNKSLVTGIPVDRLFSHTYEYGALAAKVGLAPDRRTILVMGGGAGVLPMDKIIAACDGIKTPVQIIAVTGKNSKMYGSLARMRATLRNPLIILGFVDNIHELMAVADLLISKPGGLTSTEALCRGLPMLVYRPIPGQEEANTCYLVEHNTAKRADSLEDVKTIVTDLFDKHPEQLENLRQCARRMARPAAATDIARHILSLIEKQ